jgi:hypothetical protein
MSLCGLTFDQTSKDSRNARVKCNISAPLSAEFRRISVMAIAQDTHTTSSLIRNHDRWFIAGFSVMLAAIALAALYFASGGPGHGEDVLAVMAAFP